MIFINNFSCYKLENKAIYIIFRPKIFFCTKINSCIFIQRMLVMSGKNILKKISLENNPIEIKFNNSINQKLYYGNSSTFNTIKFYPYALFLVALFFSLIVFQ